MREEKTYFSNFSSILPLVVRPSIFQKSHRIAGFLTILSLISSLTVFGDDMKPLALNDIGVVEHTGQYIDLSLKFQDQTGRSVALGEYFTGHKPVIFFLVYYGCPQLCTMILNGAVDSLKKLQWSSGEQYEVVAVSIDPREQPPLAQEKLNVYTAAYAKARGMSPESIKGWHFLVGDNATVGALSNQLGFKYKWVEEENQYAHASAFFVLTPQGKISRYFYGIDYPVNDVRVALLEASQGRIGNFLDRFLLYCYHYDASSKKYVLLANRLMTVGGAVTLLGFMIFYGQLWLRRNKALTQRG